MNTTAPPASADDRWTRYWHAPRLASCGPADSAYAGPIAAHWERLFLRGLRPGQRLLDLCAGNGAIAVLAARTILRRKKGRIRIDAIDRAAIDPLRFLELEAPVARQIRYHPKTDATALPFPEATFSWVVSQFGVEYAPRSAVVAEALRVTRPGGRLHFVMHAREGLLARQAERERKEAEVLRQAPFLVRTREILTQLKAGHDPAGAQLLLQALKAEIERFLTSHGQPVNPQMVRHACNLCLHTASVAPHFPLATLLAKIAELEAELDAHAGRLQDLLAAAVSQEDLARWRADLAAHGAVRIEMGALRVAPREALVAWTVDARKQP
ncbi:MAG: methyltransferase domain-containing protein [Alphaproteobacteria bacterium]|nr:MAG: methyltransferase domain-containing protein [Alphaproteobacteria bacterium]